MGNAEIPTLKSRGFVFGLIEIPMTARDAPWHVSTPMTDFIRLRPRRRLRTRHQLTRHRG